MQSETRESITLTWWIVWITVIIFFHKDLGLLVGISVLLWAAYAWIFIIVGPTEHKPKEKFTIIPVEDLPEEKKETIKLLLNYYTPEEVAQWCLESWHWPKEYALKTILTIKDDKVHN